MKAQKEMQKKIGKKAKTKIVERKASFGRNVAESKV